jgi:DNA-binding protein HU-beta
MKKTALINAIVEKTDLSKSNVQKVLDSFIEIVTDQLKQKEEVQITGFGKFYTRKQKERVMHSALTGKAVHVPEKVLPAFKPGSTLKKELV